MFFDHLSRLRASDEQASMEDVVVLDNRIAAVLANQAISRRQSVVAAAAALEESLAEKKERADLLNAALLVNQQHQHQQAALLQLHQQHQHQQTQHRYPVHSLSNFLPTANHALYSLLQPAAPTANAIAQQIQQRRQFTEQQVARYEDNDVIEIDNSESENSSLDEPACVNNFMSSLSSTTHHQLKKVPRSPSSTFSSPSSKGKSSPTRRTHGNSKQSNQTKINNKNHSINNNNVHKKHLSKAASKAPNGKRKGSMQEKDDNKKSRIMQHQQKQSHSSSIEFKRRSSVNNSNGISNHGHNKCPNGMSGLDKSNTSRLSGNPSSDEKNHEEKNIKPSKLAGPIVRNMLCDSSNNNNDKILKQIISNDNEDLLDEKAIRVITSKILFYATMPLNDSLSSIQSVSPSPPPSTTFPVEPSEATGSSSILDARNCNKSAQEDKTSSETESQANLTIAAATPAPAPLTTINTTTINELNENPDKNKDPDKNRSTLNNNEKQNSSIDQLSIRNITISFNDVETIAKNFVEDRRRVAIESSKRSVKVAYNEMKGRHDTLIATYMLQNHNPVHIALSDEQSMLNQFNTQIGVDRKNYTHILTQLDAKYKNQLKVLQEEQKQFVIEQEKDHQKEISKLQVELKEAKELHSRTINTILASSCDALRLMRENN